MKDDFIKLIGHPVKIVTPCSKSKCFADHWFCDDYIYKIQPDTTYYGYLVEESNYLYVYIEGIHPSKLLCYNASTKPKGVLITKLERKNNMTHPSFEYVSKIALLLYEEIEELQEEIRSLRSRINE